MFDHFPNIIVLVKLNKKSQSFKELKNQLFGKKNFSDFPADQLIFFFSKIFLKNFLMPKPTRVWHTLLKKT